MFAGDLGVQGSLRGRVGYAFDRLLLYGTGGLNVASVEHDYRSIFATRHSSFVVGEPTVSVGAEYAFDDRWRAHVEYRLSGVATRRQDLLWALPGVKVRHEAGEGQIKLGVSYRFEN